MIESLPKERLSSPISIMSENKKSENLETKPHLPPELSPKGALDPIVLIEKTPPHEVTRLTSPIREATEELSKAPSKTNETTISSRRRQKSAKSPTKEESPDISLEKEHDINVTASKSKTKLKKVDEPSLLLPIQSQVEHTTSQISDNLSVVEEVEKTTSRRGRKKISEIASSLKERAKTSKTEPQDEKLCPNVIEVSIIPKKRGRKKAVENIEQIVTPDDKTSNKTDKRNLRKSKKKYIRKLRILYANLDGINGKTQSLETIANTLEIDIIKTIFFHNLIVL